MPAAHGSGSAAPAPGNQKAEEEKVNLKWYELDRLVQYRDPILLIGFLCVVIGVALVFWPGALIVLGAGLIVLSWLMAEK